MTIDIDDAINALLAYQQADMEGTMVLTSRQAIHEVANEIRRIRAVAQSSQVPEGWKLVPLIPTQEMIEVGCDNNATQWNEGTDSGFPADVANDVYVSMVRAAQPPAAPVETDSLHDSRNPNHGRVGGLRDTAAYPDLNDAAHADPGPHSRSSAATEVLDFLNSIEGAGYGGMASFEIARAHVQDMLGTTKSAQVPMSESKYGLLPCPFCGAPARTDLLPHVAGPGWVQCSECECDQIMSDTLDEAVERWNRRAVITSTEPQAAPVTPDYSPCAYTGYVPYESDEQVLVRIWGFGKPDPSIKDVRMLYSFPPTTPPDERAIRDAFDDWSWTKQAPALGLMTPGAAARSAFQAGVDWSLSLSRPPLLRDEGDKA